MSKSEKEFHKSRQDDYLKEDARQKAVQELVSADIYKLLLGDQAYEVTLSGEKDDSLSLVHSTPGELFQKLDTVLTFSTKPTGFEEIIAACDLLRDPGYIDRDNLLVELNNNALIYNNYGKSFTAKFTDFGSMVSEKYYDFSYPSDHKPIPFNIEKYSRALNQMLGKCTEEQMNAFIDTRLGELEKAGFDPHGIMIGTPKKSVKSFDELKTFYKKQMKENIAIMQDIAKSAKIISKFNDMSPEFMNGGWLEAFTKSKTKDPVAYAAHHNIKIDGKDAIQWAYDNNYKIKISPEKSLEPLEYMKLENLRLSSSAKEGAKKSYSQDEATAGILVSLVDSLAGEAAKGKLTEEKVKKLYDKVLSNLEKQKYLTKQDVQAIKDNPSYQEHVKKTTELINAQTPSLEGKDKMYYQVARFTKAIGLSVVSEHFMKKIPTEKLEKIHAIEKALSSSVEISFKPNAKLPTKRYTEKLQKLNTKVQQKLSR